MSIGNACLLQILAALVACAWLIRSCAVVLRPI